MFQFIHASADPRQHRTTPIVVLCVVALHALVIRAFWLSPVVTDLDNQRSMAMEMVLAPMNSTPSNSQQAIAATPQAVSPTTAVTATHNTEAAHATPANAAPAGHTPSSATGAPSFSLPSSEAQGLNNPKPAYPRMSRRLNEQGQVVVRVFVAADGSPQQGEIKASSGYDRLDQEALRTVLRWRFVPGQRLGTPEAMWFNVPVNFVLE